MKATTLGELKKSGYVSKTIKDELRDNLIDHIKNNKPVFTGIFGYENTVLPDLERAILSKHHINLLGLRGQAKTRLARQMVTLLDEFIPVVEGSELNDDPLKPISTYAINKIAELGDATPITWLHRNDRYAEKLATPDVSVADLIGDVDPIKAANLRLSYADERVIHYGIIPRSNRCIFVINELPDLQARIQVALFNILQEGDIQIRGFKIRILLDIEFIFTANPEDYTNRGSIVTPLKDRIGSQILTHYPKTADMAMKITKQEAKLSDWQKSNITINDLLIRIIEQVAIEARESEFVDSKSGVSARLTISAYENLASTIELRLLQAGETSGIGRIADLLGIIPAINGKIELVYEGEQEGAAIVAQNLINKAIRNLFITYFPDPTLLKKKKEDSPYKTIIDWFGANNGVELLIDDSEKDYRKKLSAVPGLVAIVEENIEKVGKDEIYIWMEFVLHALSEHSQIGKQAIDTGSKFSDLFGSLFSTKKTWDREEN
jgi:magnesium chelatase subunit I